MSIRNILNYNNDEDSSIKVSNGLTHFKSGYKTHTNFSKNCVDIMSLSNTFNSSCTVFFDIDKIGDLLSNITLSLEIEKINTDDKAFLGDVEIVEEILYALIDTISFKCGDKVLQTFSGYWIYIWHQLNSNKNENMLDSASLYESNKIGDKYYLNLQIPFWFCREINKSFPLVALENEKITVELKLIDFNKIKGFNINFNIENVKLICEYINLDNDEKLNYINNSLEYIIEQIDFTTESIDENSSSIKKIDIPKYPYVNELIWVLVNTHIKRNFNNYFNFSNIHLENHMKEVRILFNGKLINSNLKPSYYNKIQMYQNHTNASFFKKNSIYSHSFALNNDKINPSGILSLNKYNTVVLELKILPVDRKRDLILFIKKFNIMRIKDGYLHLLV